VTTRRPLLTLSPARMALELRHASHAAEHERDRRRHAWLAMADTCLWLASAYGLLFLSFWLTNTEWATMGFWAALALGNFGPLFTGFRYWAQEET